MYQINKRLPIFVENIGDPFNLKEVISEYRKTISHQKHTSNVKAWQSSYFTHNETNIFDESIDYVLKKCDLMISNYYKDNKITHKCINMWVMQYEENDHAVNHCHYPADYSCVYYIDVSQYSAPLIIEKRLQINPESGMLVVFPGIINHEVPPTKSGRTAMALNIVKQHYDISTERLPIQHQSIQEKHPG